jgi:hypothetical protein
VTRPTACFDIVDEDTGAAAANPLLGAIVKQANVGLEGPALLRNPSASCCA